MWKAESDGWITQGGFPNQISYPCLAIGNRGYRANNFGSLTWEDASLSTVHSCYYFCYQILIKKKGGCREMSS